jgi:hypothetical protein
MDAGKQPLDIVRALSNSEELDAQPFKEEGTRDESIASHSPGSSNSTSSPQAFDVRGTESFETNGQSTQAQESLRESGYYNMLESRTTNSSFEQFYSSFSRSTGDSNGSIQGYTAVGSYLSGQSNMGETAGNHTLASSQITHSQPQMAPPTESLTNPGLANAHQTSKYTTGNQSLFCEPLFDHTDYYRATSVVRPMQQNAHIGPREGMISQDIHTSIPQEQLLGTTETVVPNFDASSSASIISEQATEDTSATSLRVHPNYRNHFNNLTLSSSIRANGYPRYIQDVQIRNIFVPNWAVTSLNTEPDPGGLDDAFGDIFKKATVLLKNGEPVYRVVGDHPNIAALYDQEEFDKSCLLSQWAARMVHSVKRQGKLCLSGIAYKVYWNS